MTLSLVPIIPVYTPSTGLSFSPRVTDNSGHDSDQAIARLAVVNSSREETLAERKLRYGLYLGVIQRHERQIRFGTLVEADAA